MGMSDTLDPRLKLSAKEPEMAERIASLRPAALTSFLMDCGHEMFSVVLGSYTVSEAERMLAHLSPSARKLLLDAAFSAEKRERSASELIAAREKMYFLLDMIEQAEYNNV